MNSPTPSLHVDVVVIGWGKGGKTLAATLGRTGVRVAVIERSSMMAGGTCINIGCVPTKALVHQAEVTRTLRTHEMLDSGAELEARFTASIHARDSLIDKVRAVNEHMLTSIDTVSVIYGRARLCDAGDLSEGPLSIKTVSVRAGADVVHVHAPVVVVNTGSVPVIPEHIDGVPQALREGLADIALEDRAELEGSHERVFTSTTIQHAPTLPKRLAIVGSGLIALEFASMFAGFGSQVTVIGRSREILPHEDEPVREAVMEVLQAEGVRFERGVTLERVVTERSASDPVAVEVRAHDGATRLIEADAVLMATGRRPATQGLASASVALAFDEAGAVRVDNWLRTSVPGVFAIGDVNGGPQHTSISLDDSRIIAPIVKAIIEADASAPGVGDWGSAQAGGLRGTAERVAVPVTVFVSPPLSMVGMSEHEARAQGLDVVVAQQSVASVKAMPRPKTLGDPRGIIRIVVDKRSDQIVGARLFHVDSQEVINVIALAMRAGVTASELREGIWTHPSSTEALNEVLGAVSASHAA